MVLEGNFRPQELDSFPKSGLIIQANLGSDQGKNNGKIHPKLGSYSFLFLNETG